MPKALHRKLSREATAKGLTGRRRQAYIYGTIARVKKARHARRGDRRK
jgi:hypothetical protein